MVFWKFHSLHELSGLLLQQLTYSTAIPTSGSILTTLAFCASAFSISKTWTSTISPTCNDVSILQVKNNPLSDMSLVCSFSDFAGGLAINCTLALCTSRKCLRCSLLCGIFVVFDSENFRPNIQISNPSGINIRLLHP
jgi:hypothetical protein